MKESIPVTRPFLPPQEEYFGYLSEALDRNVLTNDGPLVNLLEDRLADYSGTPRPVLTANGTLALQMAIRALNLSGREVITTPFSYVATTSALVWEGCKPVFADIQPDTLSLDPAQIERLITPHTKAILATHVYGIPCDIEKLQQVASSNGLHLIFDAAHGFGVRYRDRSLLSFGDISVCSFHATKLFHSVEGGAVYMPKEDPTMGHRLKMLRNFGHNGFYRFDGVGINAKNSEVHAAMGLAVLPYVGRIIEKRREITQLYDSLLLQNSALTRPSVGDETEYNYAYYPLIFSDEEKLEKVMRALTAKGVGSRRYFYPLLSKLDYVQLNSTPVAEDISRRVLCLPLYYQLSEEEVRMIARVVLTSL